MYPEKLKYLPSHLWVDIETKNIIKIGFTRYLAGQLGKIFLIETPKAGERVSKNKNLITVLTPKGKVDFPCFASGKVLEVNSSVLENPDILISECYSNWILKMKIQKLPRLLSSKKYKELIHV
jgi:glycine cleavage system H protein